MKKVIDKYIVWHRKLPAPYSDHGVVAWVLFVAFIIIGSVVIEGIAAVLRNVGSL